MKYESHEYRRTSVQKEFPAIVYVKHFRDPKKIKKSVFGWLVRDTMRNKKHIMYTHRIYVVFVVSNLLSAPSAHGASQCFALSQGTKGESEARRRKGMGQ